MTDCKRSCLRKQGCTAIVLNSQKSCALMGCTQPVPEPITQQAGETGYHLKSGKIHCTNCSNFISVFIFFLHITPNLGHSLKKKLYYQS